MKLSILTPTIPSRLFDTNHNEISQVGSLADKIQNQIIMAGGSIMMADHKSRINDVEHLVFCDNRMRSIGAKRQALVDIARGDFQSGRDHPPRSLACLRVETGEGSGMLVWRVELWRGYCLVPASPEADQNRPSYRPSFAHLPP